MGRPHDALLRKLRNGLIVSCHADPSGNIDPRTVLEYYVLCAIEGGASAIRVEGIEQVRAIRELTKLPLIGYVRDSYADGADLVTGSIDQIEQLYAAGADIVAIDATKRKRPDGTDGFIFFENARKRFSKPLWADIANFREGVRAAECGADVVATTLSGYTAGTATEDYRTPDFTLIQELGASLTIPLIAEGRIWSPESASRALALGAFAVVVGSAITRPQVITRMFAESLRDQAEGLGLL
jgi:N-acylglucosamine-6-phosphate 2-epimerase